MVWNCINDFFDKILNLVFKEFFDGVWVFKIKYFKVYVEDFSKFENMVEWNLRIVIF